MRYQYKRFCAWASRNAFCKGFGFFGSIRVLLFGFVWIVGSMLFFAFSIYYGLFYVLRWLFCKIFKIEMKPKQISGFDYEEQVARSLKKQGYHNIIVTPKSGDFGADIIATDKHGRKTCFQCKHYGASVGVSAVQEVTAARLHYGCDKAAVVTNSKFTKAAKELALSNDIDLFECYEALFY